MENGINTSISRLPVKSRIIGHIEDGDLIIFKDTKDHTRDVSWFVSNEQISNKWTVINLSNLQVVCRGTKCNVINTLESCIGRTDYHIISKGKYEIDMNIKWGV